jgi:hypothetical protein
MANGEGSAARKKGVTIAKALNSIAAHSARPFTMRTQSGRFRIQKTVYLLKHVGYPPAQKFEFNIYHMGPYSPELAACYYELEDDGLASAPRASDVPPATLQLLADALGGEEGFLEGLTTTLDGVTRDRSPAAAINWARSIKPHLSEQTWKEVRSFLGDHRELIPPT